jgi:hypothetical protein
VSDDKVVRLVRVGDADKLSVMPAENELLAQALENLDSLRDALVQGRIKAFFAVGIAADHSTFSWSGKCAPTTILEFRGAWSSMDRFGEDVL